MDVFFLLHIDFQFEDYDFNIIVITFITICSCFVIDSERFIKNCVNLSIKLLLTIEAMYVCENFIEIDRNFQLTSVKFVDLIDRLHFKALLKISFFCCLFFPFSTLAIEQSGVSGEMARMDIAIQYMGTRREYS